MESKGNKNYPADHEGGVESFASTLHWGTDFFTNQYNRTHKHFTNGAPLSADFHVYGLYWDANKLYSYIDKD